MANIQALFRSLLPQIPLVTVTVTAVNADGTSTVATMGGGSMRVIGTSVPAPNKAYVQDGKIVGEAPSLTYYELEV
jgi:hypothetical protein